MIVKRLWIDDMKCLFPTLDAFSNKRQQHAIFFFGSVKESADMSMLVEGRSCQVNGTFGTIHVIGLLWPTAWGVVAEAARAERPDQSSKCPDRRGGDVPLRHFPLRAPGWTLWVWRKGKDGGPGRQVLPVEGSLHTTRRFPSECGRRERANQENDRGRMGCKPQPRRGAVRTTGAPRVQWLAPPDGKELDCK